LPPEFEGKTSICGIKKSKVQGVAGADLVIEKETHNGFVTFLIFICLFKALFCYNIYINHPLL